MTADQQTFNGLVFERAPKDRTLELPKEQTSSVVDMVLDYLEAEGVDCVFGVPGGPLTSFFEALSRRPNMRYVLARHEGGAAFMANSYARAKKGLAVCCVTSGPGATNALTGISGALRDSLPVLFLTGQVATKAFGKGGIQESTWNGVDVVEIFRPVTKMSVMISTAESASRILKQGLRAALSGRCGPVHINIPADISKEQVTEPRMSPRQYRPAPSLAYDPAAVEFAARLLADAKRPCLYAGNGVALAGAEPQLLYLAESLQAPVITSPKGKGTFPEHHPLSLGTIGLGGHARAHEYLGTHDVMFVVGSSLNEFSSAAWDRSLIPSMAMIQVDIDPQEIGRNYPVDVGLCGDASAIMVALSDRLHVIPQKVSRSRKKAQIAKLAMVPRYDQDPESFPDHGPLQPPQLVMELRRAMPDDGMLFVDNGNSIVWGGHYFEARQPNTYFIDLGIASMGSAVAGVVGGKIARPKQAAVALVGDAAFCMHGLEVHTAVELGLQCIWVVLNNAGHAMVGQGEKLLLGRDLGFGAFKNPLDLTLLARGMGARGLRATTALELRSAIQEALRSPGPTVIDAIVDRTLVPPTLNRRAQSLARFFGSKSNAPS